jgi:LysR family glycine cleavage system transcriptional activator
LSFKKAADELSVTPTAVSHLIKGLEDYLGVTLFRRLTRALDLTAEGAAMLPKVREGMECLAAAVERTRPGTLSARLSVSAPPSFASRWLVPRLQRFAAAQPLVELHVAASIKTIDGAGHDGDAGLEDVDLRDGTSALSVRFGTGQYPGYRVERILAPIYIAVCSPKLLTAKRPLRCPADIRYHVLIHDDTISNEQQRPTWQEWLQAAAVDGVDASAGPHFSDSGLALAAAVDGLGIVLASKPLVAPEIAAGRLTSPFDIAIRRDYAYYLVTPQALAERPAVAAFRDWLLGEAGREEA